MTSASETCAQASSGILAGRPSASTPIFLSAAADRDAISATVASSPACAQDASRRNEEATPASAPSSSWPTGAIASQPARSGPVGSDSAIRPAITGSGIWRVQPDSIAAISSAWPASAGSAWLGSVAALGTALVAAADTRSASGSRGPVTCPLPGLARLLAGPLPVCTPRFHGAGSLSAATIAAKSKSHDQESPSLCDRPPSDGHPTPSTRPPAPATPAPATPAPATPAPAPDNLAFAGISHLL